MTGYHAIAKNFVLLWNVYGVLRKRDLFFIKFKKSRTVYSYTVFIIYKFQKNNNYIFF